MPDYITLIAGCFELALAGVGCVLLWRLVFSPAARARARSVPPALPTWEISTNDFGLFLLCVICGHLVFGFAGSGLAAWLALTPDAALLLGGAAGQIGMLLGIAAFHRLFRPFHPSRAAGAGPGILSSGLATFLMLLPLILLVSKPWEILLHRIGFPVEPQDLIELFIRLKSPGLRATLGTMAIFGAPLAEELLFRAGLFRYARTRLPRAAALLIPALLFALLHFTLSGFVPLVLLAVVFSLAYERTGRIGTAIAAHAIFNLNSIVLILAGVAS